MSTEGKPIKCKAMVARAPKQPLVEEEITVMPPKAGEVRVKVVSNALCHTDIYTLDGHDPEGEQNFRYHIIRKNCFRRLPFC